MKNSKIIKKQRGEPVPLYSLRSGERLYTYGQTVEEIVTLGFSILQGYFEILKNAYPDQDIGKIGEILTKDAEKAFLEADDYVRENLGSIELVRVGPNNAVCRGPEPEVEGHEIIDVLFEPVENGGNK